MRVDGEVFRAGVAKVTLIKGATLLDARMDNRPLPVIAESGGHVALLDRARRRSRRRSRSARRCRFTPGRGAFILPVPAAGSVTATIDVPGDQTDVHLSTGLILRRRVRRGPHDHRGDAEPGTPTEVWWSTHDSAPANGTARDVRLLADVKSIVTIGDADVRLVSLVNATDRAGRAVADCASPSPPATRSSASAARRSSAPRPQAGARHAASLGSRAPAAPVPRQPRAAARAAARSSSRPAFRRCPPRSAKPGEVAVEGLGTLEVTSPEIPGLRRMDVREVDPSLAAAARQALLAAYRYQRTGDAPPALALDVRRFADAEVLAAVAERAVATTL